MKKRNLLLLLSLTVASLSAYSQACFNSANDYVFEGPSSSRCITKADFDNDGDLDVVLGNYTGFNDPVLNRLYFVQNNGDATFNTPVSISSGSRPIDVISSDFNNDGDMDLAVVNFENTFNELGILIGNGDGTFQAPVRYDTEFGPNNLSIGDFNGDGHEDIAVTTNGSTVNVFLADNTTPGTFLAYTSLTLTTGTNPQDVATGDFNGDTFIDIVTANKGTANVSVFNGDGSGGFAADVAYGTDADCNGVTVVDLDGDTNIDIISANEAGNNVSVLINDGAGGFDPAVNYAADNGTTRIEHDDVNNDGDEDIVAVNGTSNSISVFVSNGDGTLQPQISAAAIGSPTNLVTGDFDGDANVDVILSCLVGQVMPVFLGDGTGAFEIGDFSSVGAGPDALFAEDINGDGINDFVVVNETDNNATVHYGVGDGTFTLGQTLTTGTDPSDVSGADLDGNGFIDIIVTNYTDGNISVFMNTAGTLGAGTTTNCNATPIALDTGDVDNDGEYDIVVLNENDQVSVMIGNGSGGFGAPTTYATGSTPLGLDLGDANNDNVPDLAVANSGSNTVSYYLNNGTGVFLAPSNLGFGFDTPRAVRFADVTGDGFAEIVTANFGSNEITVNLNNGSGTLSPVANGYSSGDTGPMDLTVNDFDNDGDIDVVGIFQVSVASTGYAVLFDNDGTGTLSFSQRFSTGINPQSIVYSDFNGDGNLDLAVSNFDNNNVSILLNAVPTITALGPTTFCSGSLNIESSPADIYNWSTTETTQTISVNTSGTYSVTTSNQSGTCTATSNSITVTVSGGPSISASGTTTICEGQSTSITVSGGADTYTWDSGLGTGPTKTLSPTTTTTYNVTGEITATGCQTVLPVTITVNPLPDASFATLNASYCSDEPVVNLSPATTGGTFTGSGTSGTTFDPSLATPGSVTVTYNVTDGNGCSNSSSQSTTVNAIPDATFTTLDASYCEDATTVTLVPTTSGGTFTGSGVSGTTFDPTAATPGSVTVTYNVTSGGCSNNSSQSTTVNTLPDASFATLNASYCSDEPVVNLSPATTGGTFTGSGTSGTTFDPSIATPGSITVTYNVTDGNGCSNSSSQSTTVNAIPDATFTTLNASYCEDATAVTLVPTTSGGTFTGSGVSGTTFDPSAATPGSITVTYNVTAGNGCSSSSSQNTTVNTLPDASFASLNASYCSDEPVVNLSPATTGGTFTGSGTSGTSFDPSAATPGSVTVTYNVTDGNGCSNSSSQSTTVNAIPDATFTTLDASYCEDATAVTLVPTTSGGTFSGSGVSGTTFDPSAATPGSVTVTYNITAGNGCSNNSSQNTTVNTLPDASFTTLDPDYCADATSVTLTPATSGGSFTGSGVSGTTFDPSAATPGSVTVTYNVTDGNGCSNNTSQNTTVNALPDASFISLNASYCSDDAIVDLNPTTSGGTFTGSGVTGTDFDPSAATIGAVSITYNVTDGNGCSNSSNQSTTVNQIPVANFVGLDPVYCENDDVATLVPATGGGTFTGPSTSISGFDFDPSNTGTTGTITITYDVTDGNGCSNSSSANTEILATPDASFGTLDPEYCANDPVVTLVPTLSGGTFTGPGMTGADFSPPAANTGVNTIVYEVTGGNGCTDTSFQDVIVHALPDAIFTTLDPTYCQNAPAVVLTPNQAGGAFVGTGITNGNEFHPGIPPVGNTNVQYIITDANNCTNSTTQNVDILPLPDLNINYNLLVLESEETSTFATYQWVDCNNGYAPISGATSQTFTVNQNGSYACIVSNGSCEDTTACINVMDVSVEDYKTVKGVKVYPNPTNGRFNIVLEEQAYVAIYSSIGKLMLEKQFNKGINVVQSLNEVATGMYMIQVKYNDGSIVTEKIIVEH